MGTIYRWRIDAPNIPAANFGGGIRAETAPFGLEGGKAAPPHKLSLHKANGEVIPVDAESLYHLDVGDVYEIYESGGGGFGHPYNRPVENVLADIRNGLVSAEKAKKDYGVVIDPASFAVNYQATAELRSRK